MPAFCVVWLRLMLVAVGVLTVTAPLHRLQAGGQVLRVERGGRRERGRDGEGHRVDAQGLVERGFGSLRRRLESFHDAYPRLHERAAPDRVRSAAGSPTSLDVCEATECQKCNGSVAGARRPAQNHLMPCTQTRGIRFAGSDCGASSSLRQAADMRST